MFSDEEMERMNKEYIESGQREKNIFAELLTHIYKKNDTEQNISRNLENKLGEFYIHEKIYGVEGGTCWDGPGDDNNHEVMTSDKAIVNSIVRSVEYIINQYLTPLNLDTTKVEEWLDSNVKSLSKYSYIKDYWVAEYYGNSSTYGIYKIDFNNLIEHACSDKEKGFYKESLAEFRPPIKSKNNFMR